MIRHEVTEQPNGTHKCVCGAEMGTAYGARRHLEEPSKNNGKSRYKVSTHSKNHYGVKWEMARTIVKVRDDFSCVECGITDEEHRNRDDLFGKGLHIHHITPVRKFANPEDAHQIWNLECLCADCHRDKEKDIS